MSDVCLKSFQECNWNKAPSSCRYDLSHCLAATGNAPFAVNVPLFGTPCTTGAMGTVALLGSTELTTSGVGGGVNGNASGITVFLPK